MRLARGVSSVRIVAGGATILLFLLSVAWWSGMFTRQAETSVNTLHHAEQQIDQIQKTIQQQSRDILDQIDHPGARASQPAAQSQPTTSPAK